MEYGRVFRAESSLAIGEAVPPCAHYIEKMRDWQAYFRRLGVSETQRATIRVDTMPHTTCPESGFSADMPEWGSEAGQSSEITTFLENFFCRLNSV